MLTSGGESNCLGGKTVIGQMLKLRREKNGPEVLIGAGVKAAVIRQFREEFPDAAAFHMSGKTEIPSTMTFRKEGVPMGLPGFDEWHIQQTGEDNVREARIALDT